MGFSCVSVLLYYCTNINSSHVHILKTWGLRYLHFKIKIPTLWKANDDKLALDPNWDEVCLLKELWETL